MRARAVTVGIDSDVEDDGDDVVGLFARTADAARRLARERETFEKQQRAREQRRAARAAEDDDEDEDEDDDAEPLWEEEFEPKTMAEFVGNAAAARELKQWVDTKKSELARKDGRSTQKPAVLLVGASGVGKTLLARLVLRGAGYGVWTGRLCAEGGPQQVGEANGTLPEALELLASGARLDGVTARPWAALIETLEGMNSGTRTRLAALLRRYVPRTRAVKAKKSRSDDDEDDGGGGSDSGSSSSSSSSSEEEEEVEDTRTAAAGAPQLPIVLTADTTFCTAAKPFVSLCHVIKMARADDLYGSGDAPTTSAVVRVLETVAVKARLPRIAPATLRHIAEVTHGNVRAAVNALQYINYAPRAGLGGGDADGAALERDDAVTFLGMANRLCFGGAMSVAAATRSCNVLTVKDTETTFAVIAQNAPAVVEARGAAAAPAVVADVMARVAALASMVDVGFQRMTARKEFDMADCNIVMGTWGMAATMYSAPQMLRGAFARQSVRVGTTFTLHTARAAMRKRLAVAGIMTHGGMSAAAVALAVKPYATADALEAAESATTLHVGVVEHGGAKDTGGRGGKGGAAQKALEERLAATKRTMRREGGVLRAETLPLSATLDAVAPRPLDVHDRLHVLRPRTAAVLAAAALRPAQHAERKRVLTAAHLYVPDAAVMALLTEPSPFTCPSTSTDNSCSVVTTPLPLTSASMSVADGPTFSPFESLVMPRISARGEWEL